jgi:pimeloyl-ACP methyl ester carboxylesterase
MRDRSNRLHVLEAGKVPLLLLAGDSDPIIPAAKTFTADGPHVQQVLLEGVGHMGMMEAPEKMAEAIARFVRREFT